MINLKNNCSFDVGERLRELRLSKAMTQEQLAHTANITPAYLGQIERNQKKVTVRTLEKVCHALNVSMAEFFSTAKESDKTIDEVGNQILHQLHNKTEQEKQAILRMVKLVFQIKEM